VRTNGCACDRLGVRRALTAGLGLFMLASAGCGLAPSVPALVAARLVQGSAAAVILPATMALIRQAFPGPAARARALAAWAMGGAAASPARRPGGRRAARCPGLAVNLPPDADQGSAPEANASVTSTGSTTGP
jgi:MFS family permease